MQLEEVVPDAVRKHPDGAPAADHEGLPPPVVVLLAELDVDGDDGHLGNCHHQDDGDDGQEAKDVVVSALVLPERLEDEEELDEDDGKGDQAGEECRLDRLEIPRLLGHLARNRCRLGRMLPCPGLEIAIRRSHVHQRYLHTQPKGQDRDEGAKGNRRTRSLRPHKQVQDKDEGECHSGEEQGGDERILSIILAVETLEHARRKVSREESRKDKQAEAHADETASEARVQHTESAEEDETNSHEEQLHARSNQRGHEIAKHGSSEDVSM